MKLRWVEREVEIVTIDSGSYTQKVKVLQYLDESCLCEANQIIGKWVDVPTEVEEV